VALVKVNRDSEADEVAGGLSTITGVSSSFTPSNNSLLVVIASFQGDVATAGTSSISGGSLTWNKELESSVQYFGGSAPNYWGRTTCWTAPVGTSPGSMTVTCSHTQTPSSGDRSTIMITVFEFTGYNTSSPVGATASNTTAADAGLTLTLSASPASDSYVLYWRFREDNSTVSTGATPNSAWTEEYDINSPTAGYSDLWVSSRTGSTSTSCVCDDTSTNASASSWLRHSFAIEIKADSAITGSLTATLAALTSSTSGTVEITGSLAKTLGAITSSTSGTVTINGSLAKTLGAVTLSAAGSVDIDGTLAKTLAALAISAAGEVGEESTATLSQTLAALMLSASGTVDIDAALAKTLAALSISASGTVDISASLSKTLGTLTTSATGTVDVAGSLSKTLGVLTVVAFDTSTVEGSLSVTLGSLTLDAEEDRWRGQGASASAWSGQSGSSGIWTPQSGSSGSWTVQ
jgi:hypothetical protein